MQVTASQLNGSWITAGPATIVATVTESVTVITSATINQSLGLCKICGKNEAEKFFRYLYKWPSACYARCGKTRAACGSSGPSARRKDAVCSTCIAFKNVSLKKYRRDKRASVSSEAV